MSPESKADLPSAEIEQTTPHTPEAFADRWGDKIGFTAKQLAYLWRGAARNYADLPAHNFGHATDSLWSAMEWADRYEAANSTRQIINRKLLVAAMLFHDAGLDQNYAALGFETPEELAGSIFQLYSYSAGYNESEATTVVEIICSTSEAAPVENPEQVIAGLSDIYNLGGSYEECYSKTLLFRAEAEFEQGPAFSASKFRRGTLLTLAKYLTKNLSLDGVETAWREKANANFQTMVIQFAGEQKQTVTDYVQSIGSSTVKGIMQRVSGYE